MKSLVITSAFLFFCGFSFAQQNTTATGGEATGSGGTVSYSVGQIDYVYQSGSNGNLNQGVQQPYELLTTSVAQNTIAAEISAFPNPATDVITVKMNSSLSGLIQICDMNGKLISSITLTALQTTVDVKSLASGVYFLNVISENKSVKQFKLIKNK